MESRYDDGGAAKMVEAFPDAGEDVALRVYTSRLLGADETLVLHGGGNTSVKTTMTDALGDTVEVLCVKGSGWDLKSIEPAGLPACRLDMLRRACELPALSDEEMVKIQRRSLLDPTSPNPSVETLLHAFLPFKFVDHSHADAVLAVVDQKDGVERARSLWGPEVLVLPYVMPGFALARAVVEAWRAWEQNHDAPPRAMLLDKHGAFTWGDTARESYEAMITLVTRAEEALPDVAAYDEDTSTTQTFRDVGMELRGAMRRVSGQGWLVTWRQSAAIRHFLRRPDVREVSQRGCATPDHVLRTKAWPMLLPDLKGCNPDQLHAEIDRAIGSYAEQYQRYFERNRGDRDLTALDPWPRVVLAANHGVACLGRSVAEANVVADVYEHTIDVIERASTFGAYHPVDERSLFDVEYWSLEQAKLARRGPRKPLEGLVALVTGAASGIGLAASRAFLAAGAHVVMTDRDERVLEAVSEWPQEHFPGRFVTTPCDVRSDEDAARAVELACLHYGGLDILVSNAGTAPSGGLHTDGGDSALRYSLDINLLGHQRVAKAAADVMIAQDSGGVLLFNASKSAFNQGPDFGPYAVPKAALVALMRQYAVDLGKHGIRANAVNADRVRTKLFQEGVLESRAKARGLSPSQYFRSNLLQRETKPQQVADAFVYLATAEATTGCVVTVDGGNPAAFPR